MCKGMYEDVTEFVQQRLHCVDARAGNGVPCPLGEMLYGTEIGEVLFTSIMISETGEQ